jgi:hypothetical protein
LLAYCGRALKGEEPKLIFPKDFDPAEHLFGADHVKPEDLVLVRDPLDALIASHNGIDNVVAVLTEVIRADQLRHLAALMDDVGCRSVELY